MRSFSFRHIAFFAAVFVATFAINSIGVGFPIFWHPDELSKATQIQTGTLNFYHPRLLLLLAKLLKTAAQLDDSARTIVLGGRFVSAASAAAAVAMLAIIAARRFGVIVGLMTAALVAATPAVFVNAHFFKEDSLLLLGCALVLLALQTFDFHPTRKSATVLGVAIGLACSAKYVGVLMLIPSVAMIAEKRAGWFSFAITLGCATSVFALINAAGLFGSSSLFAGLSHELTHVTSDHVGVQFGPTSLTAPRFFLQSTAAEFAVLWLGGLIYFIFSLVRRNNEAATIQLSPFEKALFLTPLVFLLAVQMSMAVVPRYLMPVAAMATLAAVWTVARLFTDVRIGGVRIVAAILLVAGGAVTATSFTKSVAIFIDPPRTKLADWISLNLPSTAKIAADFSSGLRDTRFAALDPTARTLNQTIVVSGPLTYTSIDRLRREGFTHVVTSSEGYDRLFDRCSTALRPYAKIRKQYYEGVFEKLKQVYDYQTQVEPDDLFDPALSVYEIPQKP